MQLPPIPQLPKPRNRDQAFRAGVRGAPFVIIDELLAVPIAVSRVPAPNSNIVAVESLRAWPPARDLSDLGEAYRIGRIVRGIALALDRWGLPSTAIMQTGQALLDHGALHLRLRQPYGEDVLLDDFGKLLNSMPDHVRNNEPVPKIVGEIDTFAKKQREWDELDY